MKLNKNIYTNTLNFFKKRFIELFGLVLISLFLFFSYSLFSYSPEKFYFNLQDRRAETGTFFSKIFKYSCRLFSPIFWLNIVFNCNKHIILGVILVINKKIKNLLSKIFFTILYINLGCLFIYLTNNNSFWLIDNGNSGFVGEKSFNIINSFYPILENQFFKAAIFFLVCIFFILGSGINLKRVFLRKRESTN